MGNLPPQTSADGAKSPPDVLATPRVAPDSADSWGRFEPFLELGGVAEELVQAGIPKSHIVLGFRPPEVRKHTEYAVA